MATEYGKRLLQAMEYAGLNQKEFVAKAELPQSTVSTAITRGNSSSHTALFAKICGVNAHWLSTGEGEMIQPETAPEMSDKLKAALASVSGLLRSIPEDQWGNALMDIAEVLQKGRRL